MREINHSRRISLGPQNGHLLAREMFHVEQFGGVSVPRGTLRESMNRKLPGVPRGTFCKTCVSRTLWDGSMWNTLKDYQLNFVEGSPAYSSNSVWQQRNVLLGSLH